MNLTTYSLRFIQRSIADQRLTAWHFALILAIVQSAHDQGNWGVIKVSRRNLMELSHIKTTPTYHKYFGELQTFGYFIYKPSYHPGLRSTVTILNDN